MNPRIFLGVRVALGVAALALSYKVYRIIAEPVEFASLKEARYEVTKVRLEQIREAELAYKEKYGEYQGDLNKLIDFVTNDKVPIVLRKDSSFTYYDKVYQQDMNKDTVVLRKIGEAPVVQKLQQKGDLFPADFNPEDLRFIPFSNQVAFELAADKIDRNGVEVPVFEAKASNEALFHDVMKQYGSLIKDLSIPFLAVGSLSEPTLSGNWK
jgi:hypothetical protein